MHDAVVIGGDKSAVQIAVELAAVAHTILAVRSRVRFAAQRIGRDFHDLLKLIDRLPLGKFKVGGTSLFGTGRYCTALEQGKPDQRIMFYA